MGAIPQPIHFILVNTTEKETQDFTESEIVEIEVNQINRDIKVMIKACLYGSFMLLSIYLLFVVLNAIGVLL